MKIFTSKQMKTIDAYASNQLGLAEMILMENAGRSVADAADVLVEGACGKNIVVFVGKGNNGGDGLVAARHLSNVGARVKVVTMMPVKNFTGINARELKALKYSDVTVVPFGTARSSFDKIWGLVQGADLFIDGILGTGFHGIVEGVEAEALQLIAQCPIPVLAIDIPSGVEADTGTADPLAVKAELTVTMVGPKLGLYLQPGSELAGDIVVSDIGIPVGLIEEFASPYHLITEDMVGQLLPLRRSNNHKGDNGRVKVVAGSLGMTGAAALCSEAAVRTGAGLTTVIVPREVQPIMAVKLTEVMSKGYQSADEVLTAVVDADVIAMGPGMGQELLSQEVVEELVKKHHCPLVIDADALNILAQTKLLEWKNQEVVITPHIGEMSRLTGLTIEAIAKEPLKVARTYAQQWNCVVVLKGMPTIVALPNGETYVNISGTPGMATGGSGDVLTGMIAALVGQGMEVAEAAISAVYLHGRVGEQVARKGQIGMKAGDIIKKIPKTWQKIIMFDEV